MSLRRKHRRWRQVAVHPRKRIKPRAPNEVWSLVCMADQLVDGRRFRALIVLDVFTRDSLSSKAAQSLKGDDVVRVLNRIRQARWKWKIYFCDNSAECLDAHWFTSLGEAKQTIEAWRRELNGSRPHTALGERTANEFAGQLGASAQPATDPITGGPP